MVVDSTAGPPREPKQASESEAGLCTVFLSHSSCDNAVAAALAAQLESLCFRVWTDEAKLHVGDRLTPSIIKGIAECDFFLVALSPHSVSSEWVLREIDLALEREVKEELPDLLGPLLLADCDVPDRIEDRIWADFRGATRDPPSLVNCRGYEALLEELHRPARGDTRIQRCVNTLALRLEERAVEARRDACMWLRNLGWRAISPLEKCLRADEEPLVRNFAAYAVADLAAECHQRARDALREAAEREKDPLVLSTLEEALGRLAESCQ